MRYLDLGSFILQGVEDHPFWSHPCTQDVVEDPFSTPQHLRGGPIVVLEMQGDCSCIMSANFTAHTVMCV